MAIFIRFTETANEDLERGTSLLDLPSMKETQVLDGLCGFSFSTDEEYDYIMSDSEKSQKIKMFEDNVWYNGPATLFRGTYLGQNPNSEGVIFEAESII